MARCGPTIILRHSADEIAWHTRAILKKGYHERPLVMARDDPGGGTEVLSTPVIRTTYSH